MMASALSTCKDPKNKSKTYGEATFIMSPTRKTNAQAPRAPMISTTEAVMSASTVFPSSLKVKV